MVTVNPSFHRTPIATNGSATLQRAYDNLSPEMQAAYGPRYVRVGVCALRLSLLGLQLVGRLPTHN